MTEEYKDTSHLQYRSTQEQEVQDERNFLALKGTQAYLLQRQSVISLVEYEMISESLQRQAEFADNFSGVDNNG